jgi:hypothetical protein
MNTLDKAFLIQATLDAPFYVDKSQPFIVRGGWLDDIDGLVGYRLGGFLIGTAAEYVADALNEYAGAEVEK